MTFRGHLFLITLHALLLYYFLVIYLVTFRGHLLIITGILHYCFRGSSFMAFSLVFPIYFSMLHLIECFLAQHTLQDLHQILIEAIPGCSKTCVCCAANCIDFSYCIVLSFSTPYIHYTITYIFFLHRRDGGNG